MKRLGVPHPVDVAYPPSHDSYADNAYVPAARLDPRVVLSASGRVTCVTCHNLSSPERALLVTSNHGSRL